jgi:hypothetical protein
MPQDSWEYSPPERAAIWPMLAIGVLVGTVVNALFGIFFRLVTMQVILATSPSGPDSPAMYATWPLMWNYVGHSFGPAPLMHGAAAGLAVAGVLVLFRGRKSTALLLSGLAFAAAMSPSWVRHGPPLHEFALRPTGDVVRGALLGWIAIDLHRRWTAK